MQPRNEPRRFRASTALLIWGMLTFLVVASLLGLWLWRGAGVIETIIRRGPYTYLPVALVSVAVTWLLVGIFLYLLCSDGGIFIARVTASSGVPEMVFDGDMLGPRPRTLRITYRRRDEDTLTSNTELQYLGIYQPADNSTLHRRKAAGRE